MCGPVLGLGVLLLLLLLLLHLLLRRLPSQPPTMTVVRPGRAPGVGFMRVSSRRASFRRRTRSR